MRTLFVVFALVLSNVCLAQTSINLSTPHTVPLEPAVACAAGGATTAGYSTVVTGFSADGNYALGQVSSHFTCGCPGRGCLHTYYVCTYLRWDLGGNLVSVSTPSGNGAQSIPCQSKALNMPRATPPSSEVVGSEFENAGGYMAQTVVAEICGSIACYATYFYPELLTP